MSSLNPRILEELRELERSGSPGFVAELIDLFLRESAVHVDALRAALASKDAETLRKSAHTLKGSSGNLGAMALSKVSSELQEAALAADWVRSAALLPRLEAEFDLARSELLAERART